MIKMKKRSLLKAAAAVMTTLAMAVMTVAPAFAAEQAKGQITIRPNGQALEPVDRFTAYQIFSGETSSTPEQLSNIKWGTGVNVGDGSSSGLIYALKNDTTQVMVGAEAKQFGEYFAQEYDLYETTSASEINSAQFVAGWLADNAGNRDVVDAFGKIAGKNTQGEGKSSITDSTNWIISDLDPGYYLIKDTFNSEEDNPTGDHSDNSGSTYVLEVLGNTTIDLKSTIPTVEKKVGENQDGYLAATEEDVTFTLTGTVASNIAEYDTYKYVFVDKISKGLTADKASVKIELRSSSELFTWPCEITADSVELTTNAGQENTLTITFNDLKNKIEEAWQKQVTEQHWTFAPDLVNPYVAGSISVVVTYNAKLNGNAVVGQEGNTNDVLVQYSNDPYGEGTGESTPDEVKTYALSLDVYKVDEEDTPITEAKFRIHGVDDNEGKYLQAKRVESGSYYEAIGWEGTAEGNAEDGDAIDVFKVEADGKLHIHGLELGTYVLEETETRDGYDLMAPLKFTISAEADEDADQDGVKDADGSLSTHISVTPEIEGRSDVEFSGKFEDNTAQLKITNFASPVLPHTGGIGAGIVIAVGIVVLLIGFAAKRIISKKKIEQ